MGDKQTDRQTETPYQYRRVIKTRHKNSVAKGTKQTVNFSINFQSGGAIIRKPHLGRTMVDFGNCADDVLQTAAKLGKTIIGLFSHCNVKRIALNGSCYVRNAIIRR